MQQKALFISFEGCEGSGKSTQSHALFNWLISQNLKTILTREPGGTESAEAIRNILLNKHIKLNSVSQLLLHMTARNEHIHDIIKPKLEENYIVICDRYIDSTRVYQGYGSGIPLKLINKLHEEVLNNLEPDITFVLDVPLELSLRRINKKKNIDDRYENSDQIFHEKVAEGFRTIAKENPNRCMLIDASKPLQDTELLIREKIIYLLT
jgi:dTMP kinase